MKLCHCIVPYHTFFMQQVEIIESIEDFPVAASLTKNELSYLVEEGDLRVINKLDFVFRQGSENEGILYVPARGMPHP